MVGDVAVVDAWPDAGSRAWGSVTRPMRFHAAHRLGGLPDGHKCPRQHGHGYQVGVQIDPKAIAELLATGRAVWKLVAADVDDLDEIDWWIERFGLPIDNVWVMP